MIIIRPQNYVFFLSFPSRKHFLYHPPLSFCRLGAQMPRISRIFTVRGGGLPCPAPLFCPLPSSSRPHLLPHRQPGLTLLPPSSRPPSRDPAPRYVRLLWIPHQVRDDKEREVRDDEAVNDAPPSR